MPLSQAELFAIARRHSTAEAEGDLAGTLATLDPVPLYTFWPMGLQFSGMDVTRRYYEYFFATARGRIRNFVMHGEWLNDQGLAQEYTVTVGNADGSTTDHRILGILTFGETGLSGERLYADEELFRVLLGPIWNELVPIR
jgi:hypothetical protein